MHYKIILSTTISTQNNKHYRTLKHQIWNIIIDNGHWHIKNDWLYSIIEYYTIICAYSFLHNNLYNILYNNNNISVFMFILSYEATKNNNNIINILLSIGYCLPINIVLSFAHQLTRGVNHGLFSSCCILSVSIMVGYLLTITILLLHKR